MAYTTDDAVHALKVRCQLPDADGQLSDSDLLLILTEEMRTTVLSSIRRAQSEYYVKTDIVPVVQAVRDYRIPTRAQGAMLRDLKLRRQQDPEAEYAIGVPYVAEEAADAFGYYSGSFYWGQRLAHTILGNTIRLLPTPQQSNLELLVRYFMRQSELVPVSSAAKVTNITGALVTFDAVPATWTTADRFDFDEARPNFDILSWDVEADAVVTGIGGTIDFTTAGVPSDLQVGDYVAITGQSPVVQVPVEYQPALISAASVRVLEIVGDRGGAKIAQDKMREQVGDVKSLIEPRNKGQAGRIIARFGSLRTGRYGWFR